MPLEPQKITGKGMACRDRLSKEVAKDWKTDTGTQVVIGTGAVESVKHYKGEYTKDRGPDLTSLAGDSNTQWFTELFIRLAHLNNLPTTGASTSYYPNPLPEPLKKGQKPPAVAAPTGTTGIAVLTKGKVDFLVDRHTGNPHETLKHNKDYHAFLLSPTLNDGGRHPIVDRQGDRRDAVMRIEESIPIVGQKPHANRWDLARCSVLDPSIRKKLAEAKGDDHPASISQVIAAYKVEITNREMREAIRANPWKNGPDWDIKLWLDLLATFTSTPNIKGVRSVRRIPLGRALHLDDLGLPRDCYLQVYEEKGVIIVKVRLRIGKVAGLRELWLSDHRQDWSSDIGKELFVIGRNIICNTAILELANGDIFGFRYGEKTRLSDPVCFADLLVVGRKDGKPFAEKGDSGGPVYLRDSEGKLWVVGMVLGAFVVHEGGKDYHKTIVQPITKEALDKLHCEVCVYPWDSPKK